MFTDLYSVLCPLISCGGTFWRLLVNGDDNTVFASSTVSEQRTTPSQDSVPEKIITLPGFTSNSTRIELILLKPHFLKLRRTIRPILSEGGFLLPGIIYWKNAVGQRRQTTANLIVRRQIVQPAYQYSIFTKISRQISQCTAENDISGQAPKLCKEHDHLRANISFPVFEAGKDLID